MGCFAAVLGSVKPKGTRMEFLVLGPLEIRDNGRRVKVDGGQPTALLALLLLNANEAVSLDRIVDHLWPDEPPASAAKSVQVHVSRLRTALGGNEAAARGRIETRGSGYAIAIEPGELDVERFKALVTKATEARAGGNADGSAELIGEALALWRGPPLADVAKSPLVESEIASLEELRLVAQEELIEAKLALGRHANVVTELQALARRHPMRERLRAQLMLALYRSGRQAEALQTYQDVRRVLATEAGLEPAPALRDLERAILNQDEALAPAARPAARPPRALTRSRTLLLAATASIVVVAGVIGVIGFGLTPRSSEPNAAGYENAVVKLSAGGGGVGAPIPVGNSPFSIVLGLGSAWTLNAGDQTISQIDLATRRAVRTFGASSVPTDLAAGYESLWVLDAANRLTRLDPDTGVRVAAIALPPGTATGGRAGQAHLALANGSVWAINGKATISRVDARTNKVVATIDRIAATAIEAGDGALWVIDRGGPQRGQPKGAIVRIDPRSNRVTRRIRLAAGTLNDLAVAAGAVWVTDPFAGELWRVDPGPPTLTKTIAVSPGSALVDANARAVWVVNHLDDRVYEIDPDTNAIVRVTTVGAPQNVTVDSDTAWITKALPVASCSPLVYGGGGVPDLEIASDLPLQGPNRTSTAPMVAAISLVLRERRFRAGSHSVGYRSCDDSTAQSGGFDFETCGTNAKAYSANPSLVGVIGAYDNFCSGIEILVTSRARDPVAMISPSSTYLGLTRGGPGTRPGEMRFRYPTGYRNYVRIIAADHLQAAAGAQLANQLRLQRVFVLADEQNSGFQHYFGRAARKLGVRIAGTAVWDPEVKSYRGLALRVRRSGADGVYLGGHLSANGGKLLRDLRGALSSRVAVIASDGFLPIADVITAAGPAASGVYVSVAGAPDSALGAAGSRFLDAFGRGYGGPAPSYTAAYAAQAAQLLLDAIARSDGTRGSVNRELRATRTGAAGILGAIDFDTNGDLLAGAVTIVRIGRSSARAEVRDARLRGAYLDRVITARSPLTR
jgi:DNA-binding SARP family transcriptional activator/ABC-type branched-subunit amino acid transport system substrate-binding protein/DNA-binding beta-propeller fold protein YncE